MAFLIILTALMYFIYPAVSAGLFLGIFSLSLIRLFLLTMQKTGNIKTILILLNMIKFGIVILLLFVFIRLFKLNAIMIAIGYSVAFLLTITEIFIRKPKEL